MRRHRRRRGAPASTSALAGEHPYIGIASVGFDSEANRIANSAPARLGQLVYVYGALGALATWKHAAFTVDVDGERTRFVGWSVAAANSKAYGGGMFVAPGAELDDGALDVVYCERDEQATFVARLLPKVFKGEHVNEPTRPCAARRRGARRRRPAVHGLRRRRSRRRAADDLPRPARRAAGAAAA